VDAAFVDGVAEDHGQRDPDQRAHPAEGGVATGVKGGEQEHDGLEPLCAPNTFWAGVPLDCGQPSNLIA
jgi:hypothetical protein